MGSVAILDLDETLIFACSREDCGKYDDLLWQAVCSYASQKCREKNLLCFFTDVYFVFVRPNAVETLQYCRKNFDFLLIFTAGNETHAKFIQKMLFEQAAGVKVDYVFHRDSCGKFASTSTTQQPKLTPYQKNLCHIREIFEQNATDEQKQKIDWNDCLFVEDFSFNALTNCGETLIVPKFDFPCLVALLNKDTGATTDICEAVADDVLQRLVKFIYQKQSIEPKANWQIVDKRFSMFL